MRFTHRARTILVPVFGGDISREVFRAARALLRHGESRLVMVHVVPGSEPRDRDNARPLLAPDRPRWRRLAGQAAPGCAFVDAIAGDPVDVVLAEAEHYHGDVIVVGAERGSSAHDGWIGRAVARLAEIHPRGLRVIDREPDRPTSAAQRLAPASLSRRRSHGVRHPIRRRRPAHAG